MNKELRKELIATAKNITNDSELYDCATKLIQKYGFNVLKDAWMEHSININTYGKAVNLLSSAVWLGLKNGNK